MRKFVSFVAVAALFGAVSMDSALGDPLNVRQVPVSGTSLQDALNAITNVTGSNPTGSFFDVTTEQDPFALFTSTASGGSIATFAIELSSFSGTNEFGIYDSATGSKAKVFDGTKGPGDQALISFLADGSIKVNDVVVSGPGSFVSPSNFGFYVDVFEAPVGAGGDGVAATLDYTVYTEDSKNDGGKAQALVFQGDNSLVLESPPFGPGVFTDDEFIVAFEDLLLAPTGGTSVSDTDYDDVVVLIESIVPVPAPGAIVLGVLGLGLVGWVRRRVH